MYFRSGKYVLNSGSSSPLQQILLPRLGNETTQDTLAAYHSQRQAIRIDR